MTKTELIDRLEEFSNDDIVICMDEFGSWDNIQEVNHDGSAIVILWGGGSPFSGE